MCALSFIFSTLPLYITFMNCWEVKIFCFSPITCFLKANRLKSTPVSSWPTSLNIWFILQRSCSAPYSSPDLHSLYEISRSLKNKPASSLPKIPTRKRSLKVGPNMEGYREYSIFSYHRSYCCFCEKCLTAFEWIMFTTTCLFPW